MTYQRCYVCDVLSSDVRGAWDYPVYIRTARDSTLQTALCPKHRRWWTLEYWARRFQIRIGRISQFLYPSFGSCGRCKTTWNIIDHHCTNYTERDGCFPLCEYCWQSLTPETRLPYYRALFERWEADFAEAEIDMDSKWSDIKSAVLAGY